MLDGLKRLLRFPWFTRKPEMDTTWQDGPFWETVVSCQISHRLKLLADDNANLTAAYHRALRNKKAVKPILAELQRVRTERLKLEAER